MATKAKTIKLDLSVFSEDELRAIELEIADRRKKSTEAAREQKVTIANKRLAEIQKQINDLANEAERIVDQTAEDDVYAYLSIGDSSSTYYHYNQYWQSSSN